MAGESKKATVKAAGATISGRHAGYRCESSPVLHPGDDGQICAGVLRTLQIELYLREGEYDGRQSRDAIDRMIRQEVQLSAAGMAFSGFVRSAVWTQHADEHGQDTSATVRFELYSEERCEA